MRLEAPPELLRERLTRREPPGWVGLPRLLESADTLAKASAALPGADLILSTVDADPQRLATVVRDAMRAT